MYRLWETLVFGCIPIVLSSPLDALYSQFPVVILRSWDELLEANVIDRFEKNNRNRFGSNPFYSEVQHKLSLEYWKILVDQTKVAISKLN